MKTLAITIGDPAGIGPEITLKAIQGMKGTCRFIVIGDGPVITEAARLTGIETTGLEVIETGYIRDSSFKRAEADADCGKASASYIKKAVELAQAGIVDALVTAPINKEALHLAGLRWHGHTEMLAELTDTRDYAMMLCGGPLRVILVTIHVPLSKVPSLLTIEAIERTIGLAHKACVMLNIERPKIAVAALNPHAGEGGLFGNEERGIIIPALQRARSRGILASGPYPADTLFHQAYRGDFDIVVCMYHDQGLIPLKMVSFDKGVNVTVGLPFLRTSPDHGTAYDIAWKNKANPSSMIEAIRLALEVTK